MTKRKLWNKPIHATRRPTRAYTPEEIAYVEAERAKEPPTSWERLGRALDRHPMSIQDKFYRLTMQRKGDDREPPPIGAKVDWPAHARFRDVAMKPTPEPRYVPHGCPRFAREMALFVHPPATSNGHLLPLGARPGARRVVTSPSVAAGSISTGAE